MNAFFIGVDHRTLPHLALNRFMVPSLAKTVTIQYEKCAWLRFKYTIRVLVVHRMLCTQVRVLRQLYYFY